MSRHDSLQYKAKRHQERVPFVITHHPGILSFSTEDIALWPYNKAKTKPEPCPVTTASSTRQNDTKNAFLLS
ncbi:hypothetical protein ACOMHN_007623 [Nucella lapillus]